MVQFVDDIFERVAGVIDDHVEQGRERVVGAGALLNSRAYCSISQAISLPSPRVTEISGPSVWMKVTGMRVGVGVPTPASSRMVATMV